MRDIHFQTPQRDFKNSKKIIRKNLNKVISAASGEVLEVTLPNVSISDDNLISESPEIIVDSLNPANTPLPSSVSTRDLTPSSTITTAGTKVEGTRQTAEPEPLKITSAFIDSSNPVNMPLSLAVSASDSTPSPVMSISGTKVEGTGQTVESATLQITSVKSELGVKQVKESTVQLLKSRDVRPRSKKILDAVVNALIEDHSGNDILDEGCFNQLKTTKAAVVLLNLLGVITAIWFLISGHQRATFGPTPT